MTHDHGSEYRVKIVCEDETEKLGEWMNSQKEVVQAIARFRGSPAKAYWLQVRNILCLDCPHRELTIVELPLTLTAAEGRYPRQADKRLSGSASNRTSSAGA